MKEKLIINLLRYIPLSLRRILAFFIARLSYYISLKHRLITIHDLMRSFPDRPLKEIISLAKESYGCFTLVAVDFPNKNEVDNIEKLFLKISVDQ